MFYCTRTKSLIYLSITKDKTCYIKQVFIHYSQYLKLDNEDELMLSIKTLIIGDLCSLYIKKISKNGFVFYLDKNPTFNDLLKQNEVLKWME